MKSSADSTVMEMIRLLLKYSGNAQTMTGVQKMLYELRRRLPENSPVRERLPYYWFKAGAFSERVREGMAELEKCQVVSTEDRGRYKLIRLSPDPGRLVDHDDAIMEAREMMQQIVREARPVGVHQEMRAQYERDAPTRFYPKFKLGFMAWLEEHLKRIERGDVDSNRAERLSRSLIDATTSLPILPLFDRFKGAYFDFEGACNRVLEQPDQRGRKYAELVAEAKDTSVLVWNTFAYGARIMEHDGAYESCVPGWQARFEEEVAKLTAVTGAFYSNVVGAFGAGDELEQPISGDELVERILEYRKRKEIAYVRFARAGEQTWAAPDHVKGLPEYKTFMNEGHLDWYLMKNLSDPDLARLMSCSMTDRPVFVSYSDKPVTVAYRVISAASAAKNTSVLERAS